jgi:hypothetical protein
MMAEPKAGSVARATVTHAPGAVDMSAYPLLVYSWKEKSVKVASSGTPVADIIKFRDSSSNLPEGGLARLFGLSEEELAEIERWEADENAPGK